MSLLSDNSPPGITVTGSGEASTVPDVFVLYMGSEATADRAIDATTEEAAALTRMRARAGVP